MASLHHAHFLSNDQDVVFLNFLMFGTAFVSFLNIVITIELLSFSGSIGNESLC